MRLGAPLNPPEQSSRSMCPYSGDPACAQEIDTAPVPPPIWKLYSMRLTIAILTRQQWLEPIEVYFEWSA